MTRRRPIPSSRTPGRSSAARYRGVIVVLILAGLAFAQVALNARATQWGYREDRLHRDYLKVLEDNRRLKMEVGGKSDEDRLVDELYRVGLQFRRVSGDELITVSTRERLTAQRPMDLASEVSGAVAKWCAERTPARPSSPEPPRAYAQARRGR